MIARPSPQTRLFALLLLSSSIAAAGAACSSSSDAPPTPVPDASVDAPIDEEVDAGEHDAAPGAAGWTIRAHTCPGPNRTDALFVDTDGTLWIGCGTAATGYGLFTSRDEGATWTQVLESPAATLSNFRVFSIERGPDGELYLGGVNESDGSNNRVVRIDTTADPVVVTPVLTSVAQVGRQFNVGTFRQLSDGSAVAESLNGTDALYRASAATGASAADWTIVDVALTAAATALAGPRPRHLRRPTLRVGQHHRVAAVRLSAPRAVTPAPTRSERIELPEARLDGRDVGIAANASRVVAAGVNQDDDTGRIYVSGADPYDASGYREINLSEIVGAATDKTWARGVCQNGDRVVVVGERQPLRGDTGIVVLSDDGGQTFEDVTPEGVTATVSRCTVRDDGTVIVAGAAGFIGFRR